MFEAIVNTTDRARYRRLLAAARANNHSLNRGALVPLQDSIKADLAFKLLRQLDRIQELERSFERHVKDSRQSSPIQRFYKTVKRNHPGLYAEWFGVEEQNNED